MYSGCHLVRKDASYVRFLLEACDLLLTHPTTLSRKTGSLIRSKLPGMASASCHTATPRLFSRATGLPQSEGMLSLDFGACFLKRLIHIQVLEDQDVLGVNFFTLGNGSYI